MAEGRKQPVILQAFTNWRIFVTFVYGFSSGLPLPLTLGTLDAWMASQKVDLRTIGVFSLAGIPYTVKYLWAPLLDRYAPPFLNRRTSWMAVSQLLLMIAIGVMGYCDPVHAPAKLAVVAVVVTFLSATQDIAVDAYRAELLTDAEVGPGAGASVVGGRIALLTGGAIALVLSDHFPWSRVYLIMAGLMGIGFVTSLFAPAAPAGVKPRSLFEAVVQPFLLFFKKPSAIGILIFIVLYKFGDAMAGKMITPFLIQTGFSRTDIGTVNKGFGMIATIVGAVSGGGIIARIGIGSSLWVFGFLQAFSNLSFVGMALAGKNYGAMMAAIGIENICGGMGTAAFVAFLMSLCDKHVTATQYALLSSVMALTRIFAGVGAGFLAKSLSWPSYFFCCSLLGGPGLILLWKLRRRGLRSTP
jgi:PAT family beta-lactamase induction signal transducer AmpG